MLVLISAILADIVRLLIGNLIGDRQIPPRKIPPGRFHPGCFPPENSTPMKPGYAKYAVDANLLKLESSILTRAKRATNRNNAAKNQKNLRFFGGGTFLGGIYRGGTFRGGVYLEPIFRRLNFSILFFGKAHNFFFEMLICILFSM